MPSTSPMQSEPKRLPKAALPPGPASTFRSISALMLREMSTTYGRSALGYFWAVLEPSAGIILLTAIFSLAFVDPAIGTSFPLFYATGMMPFLAYTDVSQKTSVALRFSKALMFYPRVTFVDALIARFLTNAISQILITAIVFWVIIVFSRLDVLLAPVAIFNGFLMAFALALGIGTLNCYLLSVYPFWERAWAVLNRPMFIISGIFYVFNSVPMPYRDWLWWNPLVHIIGQVRRGVYPTYDGSYVSPLYVYSISAVCFATGLLLLRRYHRDISND